MESGVARIAAGVGDIDTGTLPSPVGFDPATFSTIVNHAAVYFDRVASDPSWAANVVPADQLDDLMMRATPPSGLTEGARHLVRGYAARYCMEAQFAPDANKAAAHLEFAKGRMSALAAAISAKQRRGGLAVVRALLARDDF